MRTHHVVGGGTVFHVRPHFALCAPAYGKVARLIREMLVARLPDDEAVELHLTRMAGGAPDLETNEDVAKLVRRIVAAPDTGIVFLCAALCDFEGTLAARPGERSADRVGPDEPSGKDQPRLSSRFAQTLHLEPAEKIIGAIRKDRKDIFLVGFKTTTGASEAQQYESALALLKRSSCNLVLANDLRTRRSMVVAPELARYHVTTDRFAAVEGLVDMALRRSRLHFTRTTLAEGALVSWNDARVPSSLRTVVDHCVKRGAYKPFNGVTVGHFGVRQGDILWSSRRKQNYNVDGGRDLVRVAFPGEEVIAYGAKPSAGTRSQWAVLQALPEYDCIVHFHCPMKPGSAVCSRPQRAYECGSRECGENTKAGMRPFAGGRIAAVMLEQHGPNVVFHRDVDPAVVIEFIEANFDISRRSDEVGPPAQSTALVSLPSP